MALELEDGYYASPRWSWEITDCAMPMTFDTYSNCAHQCLYCFAFFQRAIGESADDYLHHKVKAVNVDRVKRMFLDPDKHAGQFAGYIKRKYVLQWGGLSDGFDWYERKFRKSLELLRFFKEIDYPISISTKGTWFLDDPEYVEVLNGASNTHWKYSIITTDPGHAKLLEAGTPSPEERFDAIRRLNDLGVGATTLRMRPYVIGVTDLCIRDMFQQAKDAGAYSLTTEFLCLEKRASENHRARYSAMSECSGYDMWDFYRTNSYSGSGLMRLNYELKRKYIRECEELAEEFDIPFFVSDAHHKEASATAGCCGLPEKGPLSVYNKGQFSQAMMIAKANGSVRWSEISEDAEWLQDLGFVQAEGYNHGDTYTRAKNKYHSMYDFMRDVWNNPKSWSSPARYFGGVLVPAGVDDDGDIIYLYNKPLVLDGSRVKSTGELADYLFAEREEQRKDGGELGHVAYPIFIPSKGRAGRAKIADALAASRLPFTLVVEPQDEDDYREAYPLADMLVLPENDRGLAWARQFILNYVRGMGDQWYWQLDDNITGFKKGNKRVSARSALSHAEGVASQYDNIGLVALDYQQFAFRAEKEFSVNKRAYCCVLTNTVTGCDYRDYLDAKSDVDFTLTTLAAGWDTILIHAYAMDKPTMGEGGPGGQTPIYQAGRDMEIAEHMVELWPDVTRIVKKKRRSDAVVDWSKFMRPLKLAILSS